MDKTKILLQLYEDISKIPKIEYKVWILAVLSICCYLKHGSRKFCQRGSKFDNVFFFFFFFLFVDGGIEDLNTALNGPSLACYRNAISIAGRWWPNIKCWFGSFVIFHGIQTSIAKKPFIFVIFQGVGPDPLSPSLDPPMYLTTRCTQTKTIRII